MRGHALTLALSVLCAGYMVLAKLGAPGGPRKLRYDVPDAFQVLCSQRQAVEVRSRQQVLGSGSYQKRNIDYEAETATYVWNFKGADGSSKPDVVLQVRRGPSPGTLDVVIGDDPTTKEAILYYTDDKCCVADIEYNGHQCILWMQRSLKDTVPQVCVDQFVDTCGVVVDPHRRDLCDDGEGDY
ncbi:hypothetical protein MTO96_029339 [Rhipicephalus appendiculatus]